MSEPEILSIEEVRELAKGGFSRGSALLRLCATAEHWYATAEQNWASVKDCLEAQANHGEAHLRLAAERDRLRADIDRRREVWQEDLVKLQRAEIDRASLETERDDAYRLLNEGREEIDRLRALVGRMREALALHATGLDAGDGVTAYCRMCGKSLEGRRGKVADGHVSDCIMSDPDGQGAAEELDGLRAAERRLANIHDLCREKLGQVRSGELTEEIVGRVAEELRLLREHLGRAITVVEGVYGSQAKGLQDAAGSKPRWDLEEARALVRDSEVVLSELRLLREWEAASLELERHPFEGAFNAKTARATERAAWAALRAFREGQK